MSKSRRNSNSNSSNNFQSKKINGGAFDNLQVKENSDTFGIQGQTNLMSQFGNLNYSFLPGSKIYAQLNDVDTLSNVNTRPDSIPGVMVFPTLPTIGRQDNASTDPINLAAQRVYTKVRSVNSGSKNYDQNNLMIHIMAMDSIYAFHAVMLRALAILDTYSRRNYYIPNVLADALMFDIEDLQANIKDFRGYIDLYASRAASLVVPNVIPMLTDHSKLYNAVFVDQKSILGQMYCFRPIGFYRYEENESSGNKFGTLQFEPITTVFKYADFVSYGNALLNDILNSQDMALMSGDLEKAYPDSALLTIPEIGESSIDINFVYDENVLLAIHNADLLSLGAAGLPNAAVDVGAITANATNNNLSQSIIYTPPKTAYQRINDPLFIDQHKEMPDIMDNYYAIRFKFHIATPSSEAETSLVLDMYGTELLFTPSVYYLVNSDTIPTTQSKYAIQTVGPTDAQTFITSMLMSTPFEMSPLMYYAYDSNPTVNGFAGAKAYYPFGEMYNPTLLDKNTYEGMVTAFLMASFGI